jgi:hypothetical protein
LSISSIFDDNAFNETAGQVIRPIWTLGDSIDDDTKMLEWQNNCYNVELRRHAKQRDLAVKHVLLYKGKHYASSGGNNRTGYAEGNSTGLGYSAPRVSKLVVNYLYSVTQQRVSRETKNKPTVTIMPANSEWSDKLAAKLTKYWIDYEMYVNQMDARFSEAVLTKCIMGEAYGHPFWNPNKGQVMPAWKQAVEEAKRTGQKPRMAATNSKGEPVLGSDGKPLFIQRPVRTGDIDFLVLSPLNCLIQSCGSFEKADFFIREEWVDIDELRAKYPDQAEKLAEDPATDSDSGYVTRPQAPNMVCVRHFWHRSTDFLGEGRYVVSTRTAILENGPLPDGMSTLPLVRITDIDIPGEQAGMSFFVQGKALNMTLNDFSSIIRRNGILAAHPKWLIPQGSVVKKEAIGNDISSIEYKGTVAPTMVGPPPLSQELTALRNQFKAELMEVCGISDFMLGRVPPNVRSALSMQMLDESDEARANTAITKVQTFIRETVEKFLEIAGAFYEKGDPRLIPVVGKDQRYMLEQFDPKVLQTAFDVRVTNSSGLPSSRAARTETLIELKKAFPTLVKDEQMVDLLEFADSDRFYDQAAVAARAAEAENEAMLGGEKIADPVMFENLLVHHSIHMRDLQSRGLKTTTPPEIQKELIKHTQATEYLCLEMAKKNPTFAIELAKVPTFPAFFELSDIDRLLLDRARMGNPMSLMEVQFVQQTGQPPPTGSGMTSAPPPGGAIAPPTDQGGAPTEAPVAEGVPEEAPIPQA